MGNHGFLLLPGGGMSSWIWRDLDPEIRSRSIMPERRLFRNGVKERRTAKIADCLDYIEACISEAPYDRYTIVAHSGSGILAPAAAGRFGSLAAGIVFVAANIPESGKSTVASLPLPIRIMNVVAARLQSGRESTPMRRYESVVRNKFCNTASEDVVRYMLGQDLMSEPLCLFSEKSDWSLIHHVPMAYIRLSEDRTASLELQDRMASNLGIEDRYTIDSDHMVMLSHPEEFSSTLLRISKIWFDRPAARF